MVSASKELLLYALVESYYTGRCIKVRRTSQTDLLIFVSKSETVLEEIRMDSGKVF